MKISGTMGRNAQRESADEKMYNLAEVDTEALMKMENSKLYKGMSFLNK
jgi:hypothetical protein